MPPKPTDTKRFRWQSLFCTGSVSDRRLIIGRQMFPQTIYSILYRFVVQSVSVLTPYQAFALAVFFDDDDSQFRINVPITIPVATCRTDSEFSRENQFFYHGLKSKNNN